MEIDRQSRTISAAAFMVPNLRIAVLVAGL
jgi:hypothetical protein